jgi:O-antigen ligase
MLIRNRTLDLSSISHLAIIIIACGLAFGIGWVATRDQGFSYAWLLGGLGTALLFLRWPFLPAVVIYPILWIFWAYSIPGIGGIERIIGVLGILGMALLAVRHAESHMFALPKLVMAGLFILFSAYWISWAFHPDLVRAQEYMISLTARIAFLFVVYYLIRTLSHLRLAVILLIGTSLIPASLTLIASLIFGFGFSRDFFANQTAMTMLGSLGAAIITSANFGTAPAMLLLHLYPTLKNRLSKIALALTVLFLLGMAFASQYRREILITIPLLLAYLSIDRSAGLRRPALGLLLISVLFFFLVLLPFSTVLQNRLDNETQFVVQGTEPRIASFLAGVEAFLQSPLIGYGPSAYQQAIMPILGLGRRSFEYSPYNVFIWIAVEAGTPGILGITFILAGIFREAIKFRRQSDGVEQWVLRCAPALLLVIVVWFTFGNAWELSLPWFLMGLILAAARLAQESTRDAATA